MTFPIGNRTVGAEAAAFVVAEVGHNHQGDVDKAEELVRAAADSGADAVKLQKRNNGALYTEEMFDRPYAGRNSFGSTYGSHREYLELDAAAYRRLQRVAHDAGIEFFATPFDADSVEFLCGLDVPVFKIASGDLTNIPLIRHVAAKQRPVIVSTGGASFADIERAYRAIRAFNDRICICQCTASYPARTEDLNLRVIQRLRELYPDVIVGYSSHDAGVDASLLAYALGARVIEKHFTMDSGMKGTDHAFSLEPEGLRSLVDRLAEARSALGDGRKYRLWSEVDALTKMGKKLVVARRVRAGESLKREDVTWKSPGDGLPPYVLEDVIGAIVERDLERDEAIPESMVKQGLRGAAR